MEFELELKIENPVSLAVGLVVGFALGVLLASPERRERWTARVRELRAAG